GGRLFRQAQVWGELVRILRAGFLAGEAEPDRDLRGALVAVPAAVGGQRIPGIADLRSHTESGNGLPLVEFQRGQRVQSDGGEHEAGPGVQLDPAAFVRAGRAGQPWTRFL